MARKNKTKNGRKKKASRSGNAKPDNPWIVTILGGLIATVLALPAVWIWNLATAPNPLGVMAGTYRMSSFALEEGARFYARNPNMGPFPREMLSSIELVLSSAGTGKFTIGGVEAAIKFKLAGDTLTLELDDPRVVSNDLRTQGLGAGARGGGLATVEELKLGAGRQRIFFPIKLETTSVNSKESSVDKHWFPWAYLEKG